MRDFLLWTYRPDSYRHCCLHRLTEGLGLGFLGSYVLSIVFFLVFIFE